MKKLVSVLRGKYAGVICAAVAVVFGVSMYFFREEFLAWVHLPLVGVLAALCGVCFALIALALYAQKKEKSPLKVFLGGLAFFEIVLWGLLTLINVGGAFNKRAIAIASAVVVPIFCAMCVAIYIIRTKAWNKHLRRGLAVLLILVFALGTLVSVFPHPQELIPYVDTALHGGEQAFFESWSASQAYTKDYAVELKKDPDKDFVVLNLADVQLNNEEALGDVGKQVKDNTDRLVAETKPDLITLTGDNAWGDLAYIELIKMIDSYGIPWAPVMGNHDGQGCISEFWVAYKLTHAENCLFKFGPADMGYGNYIINITENGEVIHTLFMMDTHSEIEEDNINGKKDAGYDHLWENQFAWYSWAVDGIAAAAGKPVESTVIFHIPLYEYHDAWEAATGQTEQKKDFDPPYIGEYADTCYGVRHEGSGTAPQTNGFFALIKEKGSTKNVVCGHDHVCDSSILYEGIRLTYAVKDGPGCYWEPELNGGTLIRIGSDGHAEIEQHLIDFYGE